jgi:phosphoribosylamine--glycine ligase
VVKADGLAGGKGVTIAATRAEAERALQALFAHPSAEVLIEAFLDGEEASFFVLSDGETALPLLAAQDHKRVGDGDTGPNTGGMGAYAPARIVTPAVEADVMARIVHPTLAAMRARGTPFVGVLFVGLMLTADGPRLIEYNVRFGDPECQALMALFAGDLADLLHAAATGGLAGRSVRWKPGAASTVVVAARGYPGTPARGGVIAGLDAAEATGALIFEAGTALDAAGRRVAAGGRVLAVTATGADVRAATAACYAALEKISFADGFWRRDIGWREAERESARVGEQDR